MEQLPTSKGTPRAQKQNLDKSHENMAINQKLKIMFFKNSPWTQKGTIVHHFYRNNFGTHYSKFKNNY